MKRHLSITVITLFTVIFLSGCLDENPRDRLDEDETYTTANIYQNTVGNIYFYIGGNADSQGLQGTARGVYDLNTFTTDEAMLPTRGGDWYDGGLWQDLYRHSFSPSLQPFSDTWNYLYKVIVLCNQAIAHLEEHSELLTPTQLATYTAEARALRAMYYYYLLDLFGTVPYVTSNDITMVKAEQISRSTLFHAIYDELNSLLPLLPDARSNQEGEHYGHMTRHVAYFLLAKLALNAEIWTDDDCTSGSRPDGKEIMLTCDDMRKNAWEACIYWCNMLEHSGYGLERDYTKNFAVYNEESVENIFTIPMDKNLYANTFMYLFRSRHYNHGSALGMAAENGSCATCSTVMTYEYGFETEDKRFKLNYYSDTVKVNGQVVCLDDGSPLVYKPRAVQLDLTGSPYEKTAGARMKKYEIDPTAYNDGLLQDNDIVLFRYADVLLMKAEAKVRNGQDGTYELNAVRARVGMPSREATLGNILDERLLELAWEGWRRQDLIRFDLYHLNYDERVALIGEEDRHTTVFPIPSRALSLNSHLKQNKGY